MANNTTGFTRNLVDAFGRVIPWGIMLIVIIGVSSTLLYTITVKSTVAKLEDTMIKVKNATIDNEELLQKIRRNVREGIEYSADTAISKTQDALSPKSEFAQMLRKNLRESVDFALTQTIEKAKGSLDIKDPFVQTLRRNAKEAIEYTLIQIDDNLIAPYNQEVAREVATEVAIE